MSRTERLTISLPADMVATLKKVVEQGDYPCASTVIYEALHEWKMKRAAENLPLERIPGLADE